MNEQSLNLTEIHKTLRQTRRKMVKEAAHKIMSFSRPMTEVIINSGAFTQAEVVALQGFFDFRGRVPLLNENTIKMINSEINSKFVQEGLGSWIKDKKDAVLNALKSGWEGLKKIWGNFKEFVASCIQSIKDTFKKMTDKVLEKVNKSLSYVSKVGTELNAAIGGIQEGGAAAGGVQGFLKTIDDKVNKAIGLDAEKFHATLADDVSKHKECTGHIKTKVGALMNGSSWESKIVKGEGNPGEDIAIDESIKKELKTLFSNAEVMLEFRNLNINLREDGAIAHPEDIIKNAMSGGGEAGKKIGKALSAVVKVVLGILKYTLGIFSTIINKLGAVIAKNIFKGISWLSSTMKGPGTFEMIALGFFYGELTEVIVGSTPPLHHLIEHGISALIALARGLMGWALGVAETLEVIITIVGWIFYGYAIATVLANKVLPAIQKFIEYTKTPEYKKAMGDMSRNMAANR